MQSSPTQSVCALFVVLEGANARLPELTDGLAPLTRAAEEGPFLLGVDLYYRPDTEVALLAVRFDERSMTDSKRLWVVALAGDRGLPVLDPSRLGDDDRRAFFERYLGQYGVRIHDVETPGLALRELGRLLGIELPASEPEPTARPEPVGSSPRPLGAQGSVIKHSGDDASGAVTTVDPHRVAPVAVDDRYHTDRVLVDLDDSMAPQPRGKRQRHHDRVLTIPGRPTARATSPGMPEPSGRRQPRPGSEPSEITGQSVNVRYQRGDQWLQARLRSLSTKGALLATGAPPPIESRVRLAVGLGDHGVLLDGVVRHVADEERRGSLGFRIEFVDIDGHARDRLIALLRAAKAQGVSLTPPPPRCAARFPVIWPVTVTTRRGPLHASVLDVSSQGLFVATNAFIQDAEMGFVMPLDRRGHAASGRARVAREVTELMARARGLERGYGLEIVELETEGGSYEAFLDRVRQRSERHVVVGAAPGRLEPLSEGLSSAGYTVSNASRAADLLRRGSWGRAPDVAVIDHSLDADAQHRLALQQMFERHHVLCVSTRGEPPNTARAAVDRMLAIGMV